MSEHAIDSAIERDRVVEITKALCSARQPDDTEEERARVIAALLDQPGIEVELDWVLPRRPNLVARVRGEGQGPGLLLNGHIDASYHPGVWRADPHEPWVEGTRIFGGAITDMLGALASMIAATEAAARIGPPPGDLVFLAVMHHDTIGLGAKYAFASRGGWPRYGICGEPSSLEIHVANGGAVKFELRLAGRLAHISRRDEGVDALAAAVDVVRALRQIEFGFTPEPRLPDLPLLLVGEIHAGIAPGAVADQAVVRGDVRTLPSMTRESVRADLERVIAAVCPADVAWELDLIAVQRPFLGVESGPLLDALAAAHRAVRGGEAALTSRLPGQAFITDAADMAAAGIETVVYGPADWRYVPDESVEIDELLDAARIYLGTAMRLR
jgi:acetylornithine deacetylase/succinyl-diaminopimelate desuccinylase-like protein